MGTTARATSLLVGLLALTSLSACGPEPVRDSAGFTLTPGDTRVFTAFRRSATTVRGTVRLRAGDRHVMIRVDCVLDKGAHRDSGDDDLAWVRVWGGAAGFACQEDSHSTGGTGIIKAHALRGSVVTPVVVHVPPHTTWSVVVDAGPGRIHT